MTLAPLVALLALGCGGNMTDSDRPDLLNVTAVDVVLLESFPVQVTARVTGSVPDACTQVDSVRQERSGNTVTVTIATKRRDEVCAQVVTTLVENVRLDGSFPAGSYVLRVNGVEKRFTV